MKSVCFAWQPEVQNQRNCYIRREINRVQEGRAVTVCLYDKLDVARGDIISCTKRPPLIEKKFEATLIWFNEKIMMPRRSIY